MSCVHKHNSACPFADSDTSDYVQNMGCLPSPYEIKNMRVFHGKTWACHEKPEQPCTGAIQYLKKQNLPYHVIDANLVTESSAWHLFTEPKI